MMTPNTAEVYQDFVRGEQVTDEEIQRLLAPVGFRDFPAAYRTLHRLAGDRHSRQLVSEFLPNLLATLADTARPDKTLVNFERLTRSVPDKEAHFRQLASNPRALEILITLFSGSQFLTEILLRHPEYFQRLVKHNDLARPNRPQDFETSIQEAVGTANELDVQLDSLRQLQRWELLRIGTCDLLGLWDLPSVTVQLSHLADGLIQACLDLASGQARTDSGGFVVLGMGKLGGEEINYSSDIDLLFLAGSGATSFKRLAERLIENLTRVTAEGFLYRVDMRLRPWGRVGPLVTSVDGHLAYLREHAQLWEKQALLKARIIAGDATVGQAFLEQAEPLIFSTGGEEVRANVRAMKEKIETHLRQRGREWGEVKLGQGSIRDVEFVTQYLQLAHGDTHAHIQSRNTLDALSRLADSNFLTSEDYRILADGYSFLRPVEHWLQMMHYRQTHALPTDPEAIQRLARRLGFDGLEAGTTFLARYQEHTSAIRSVYKRHLGSERAATGINDEPEGPDPINIQSHLARLSPSYTETFSKAEIEHHANLSARVDDETLVEVEAAPLGGERWRVTIVGYDYLGELSLICGLLAIHGLNILDGQVFTYRPLSRARPARWAGPARSPGPLEQAGPQAGRDTRRKIVDVFTVRPVGEVVPEDLWPRYSEDLRTLVRQLEAGRRTETQGAMAKRFAETFRYPEEAAPRLYPIEVEIDNASSDRTTILRIEGADTVGFLYELANALALNNIHISRVIIGTSGNRVQDTLHVTHARGGKITDPKKQRELRAAIVLIKHFTHLLPHSPNPVSALANFRQLLSQLFNRANWPDELTSLERPEVLDALARLLGVSDFLWNDFLRMQYANLFPVVRDVAALHTAKSKEQLQAELAAALQAASNGQAQRAALNAFKDREMLRIDMRHILGYAKGFGRFSAELTDLAEVVVEAGFQHCLDELQIQFGQPLLDNGQPCPISVCGMGKCGGRELGFASDIELVVIYAGPGRTTGPNVITTTEFFEKLVFEIVGAIRAKREGIFEIDLRLRPYGKAGSLAVSLQSLRKYFAADGAAWPYERQALVRLRPIAGDADFGRQIGALRDEIVYNGQPFDVAAMRGLRERQLRHLVTAGTINAKFSPGGLVDVEYLVQGLQITYGHQHPSMRLTNTREAMGALAAAGMLNPDDYARLHAAHVFLRRLINSLRMVRGNAWDLTVPPPDTEEFAFLARRLGYGRDADRLGDDLSRHTSQVQEISSRSWG